MKSKQIKKEIDRLWKVGKKDLDKIIKDTSSLVKKGEAHIKEISKKAEENLEAMTLTIQREKMYYDLGKSLSALAKKNWAKSKKIDGLIINIKKTSQKIKKTKRG